MENNILNLIPTRKVLLEKHSMEVEIRDFFIEWLDGCEVVIDKRWPDCVFYGKNKKTLFEKNTKCLLLYVRYDMIWSVFESRFGLEDKQTRAFIKNLLDDTLNFKGLTPSSAVLSSSFLPGWHPKF